MITLFTDFGAAGPYNGQVLAVLARLCPETTAIPVFPDMPVYNAKASAYLLPPYTQYLPPETICLCVVDPGVGGKRKGLVIRADGRWFVGPDNGLFCLIVRAAAELEIYEISWPSDKLSASFHGRDLFAPVAAQLARGEPVPGKLITLDAICLPGWPDNLFEVIYIDNFGNAITGIRASQLASDDLINVSGSRLASARTFTESTAGACFWYENSNGLVEIAANQARAADLLKLSIGSVVEVLKT